MNYQEKYNELYSLMAESKDASKMKVFGEAEKWVFEQLNKTNPDLARRWLEKIEGVRWNNYICESDAMAIASKFINQDNTRGPKWNYNQVVEAVKAVGGKMSEAPYYNEYALFLVMNMIASDHWGTLLSVVSEDMMPMLIYQLAVDKLKDVDRPHFIKSYWDL